MKLTILSPGKKIFEGEIQTSKFPGDLGQFQVLKGHASIISILKKGHIVYQDINNINYTTKVENGIVEVLNNNIIVIIYN
jgi:F-type H+-transporting ATPase subunit epsilon